MAQGDIRVFNYLMYTSLAPDLVDVTKTGGFKGLLITEDYGNVALAANVANPQKGDFTEATVGGNYASGGVTLTMLGMTAGSATTTPVVLQLDVSAHASNKLTITANASNPTAANCMLIYDDNATSDVALCVVDLSGSTGGLDITSGLEWTPDSGGTPGRIITFTRTA
jgi:hypothetical protein